MGVFTGLVAKDYPAVHASLTIFLELTDGRGETPIVVKFCRTTAESLEGEELHRIEGSWTFADPRSVARIIITVSNVSLPKPGEYRVIVETTGGAFIAERRLMALLAKS